MMSNSGMILVNLRCAEHVIASGRMTSLPNVGEKISIVSTSTGQLKTYEVLAPRNWHVVFGKHGTYPEIDGNITFLSCDVWLEEISNDNQR